MNMADDWFDDVETCKDCGQWFTLHRLNPETGMCEACHDEWMAENWQEKVIQPLECDA